MTAVQCACCGQHDPTGVGVCSPCSGPAASLVFIRAGSDTRMRWTASERLTAWLNIPPSQRSFGDALHGRQPLLAVAPTHAQAAVRALQQLELPARALSSASWYRALPPMYLLMLFAVLMAGTIAGVRAVPMLSWASWLVVGALVYGARDYLRRPAFALSAGEATLPQTARIAAASALARLNTGDERDSLLDLVRVAEQTYSALPAGFQQGDLGSLVVEITATAGPLAVEAERLRKVSVELRNSEASSDDIVVIESAARARLDLLHNAVDTLADVARHSADPTVAATMRKLLVDLRAAASHRVEAEAAIDRMLEKPVQ